MKYLTLLTSVFLAACNTAPVIVPDITKDNVVMQKLQHDITHNSHIRGNWGWILWYLPLVVIAMAWAWRRYIKECPECGKSEEVKQLNG